MNMNQSEHTQPASYLLILTTVPDSVVGQMIARNLVQRRLVACVNILPSCQSIYEWNGAVETAVEHLLMMKSRSEHFAALEAALKELHPYDLPEVVAVPIEAGSAEYLAWLDKMTLVP